MLPRIVAHVLVTLLLLCTGHWGVFALTLAPTLWLVYEFASRPQGGLGLYDPTEIHNGRRLKRHMRDCMIALGYYLIMFFIFLYWYTLTSSSSHLSFIPQV